MRRPGVVGRVVDDMSFDGIQMDVSKQDEELGIDLDESGFVASLEEVTRGLQGSVAIAGVAHRNALHDVPERTVGDLNQRVQMIGHPAEGMDTGIESSQNVGDDVVECLSISAATEECLTVVTAKNDVIAATRGVQARRSWHPCRSDAIAVRSVTRLGSVHDRSELVRTSNNPSPVPRRFCGPARFSRLWKKTCCW